MLALLPVLAASASAAILPNTPSLFIANGAHDTVPDCLKHSYYGSYGGSAATQEHIYLPSVECLSSSNLDSFTAGSIVPLEDLGSLEKGRIVWIGKAGVQGDAELPMDISAPSWPSTSEDGKEQGSPFVIQTDDPRDTRKEPITLLHQTANSFLLHVGASALPYIDTLLPSYLVPVAVPTKPYPVAALGWESVPTKYAKYLAGIIENLQFSPAIDRILSDGLDLNQVRRDVRWLTGESPSGIQSRHSFTPGAVKAAHWIQGKVEATGATCTLQPFLEGFSPNVICQYPSLHNSTENVIFSAHYDSRGSFGSTRAPGGDDDGSGTGHLLGLAHAIGSQGVQFEKQVTLAFFAGEEQGLLGSHAYAEYLHSQNASILLQVQADMLGYHAVGESLQLGLPETIHLPEASYLVGNISHLYAPELVVGTTAACCSDHQSFVSYGFPATQVFERNGGIVDPMYHNSGDLSQREGYDFEQIVAIAKVTLATLLTVAGYQIAE
ncbi:hypothetical protein B9479_003363 [Cryptococcus floricola]|uniref:Peptide hydrolase n=1 Tax=Cryptococcus floricola TaxID=2591691 RepID=A0A5D3AYV9_9TREE|nr:hypothetical protein B9479_003363 [Cryptococcus floricola]